MKENGGCQVLLLDTPFHLCIIMLFVNFRWAKCVNCAVVERKPTMEKLVRQGMLFDLYGDLLTEHQRDVYGSLVNEDLSLSEIAEDQGTSRQAVQDLIKRTDRKLEEFESKLHLLENKLNSNEPKDNS